MSEQTVTKTESTNAIPAEVISQKPEAIQVAEAPKLSRESLIAEQSAIADQVKTDLDDFKQKRSTEELTTKALLGELAGQSQFVNQLEKSAGIDDIEKQLSDINAQIQAENKLAPARLLQAEKDVRGTGVSTAMLGTRLSNRQRDNAINALVLGAQADVVQGRLASANSRIKRAVEAKYEPLKAQLEVQKFNLQRVDQLVSEGRADLTNAQRQKLDLQKGQVAKQEQDLEKAQTMQTTILKNQPSEAIRQQLLKANTVEEINAIPGIQKYLLSPIEKLDMQVKRSQLATQSLQRSKLRQAMAEAQEKNSPEDLSAKRDSAKDKLNLIKSLTSNKTGLKGAVGVRSTGRGFLGSMSGSLSGDTAKFSGEAARLMSKEALDSLIDIKKQGATFGGLSDGERRAVAESATVLQAYAQYDKNGNFKGTFKAREEDVLNELERIQRMTEKSYVVTGGELTEDMLIYDEFKDEYGSTSSNPLSIDQNGNVVIDTGEPTSDEDAWGALNI